MAARWLIQGICAGLILAPSAARAWWNEEWKGRRQIAIDPAAIGITAAEAIGPAAVLIRLHAGNFKLDQLKEDGSDLRVIAADDKTPLKFHLEKFDPLLGEALLWVGIADLKAGGRTNIWIYYGNPKATSSEDVKGTYDVNTVLVYHCSERGQPPKDSSNWGNHALGAGQSAEGASIGRGLRLDGSGSVTIPGGPSLAWTKGARMTWSAWVKPADADSSGVIYSRRDASASFVVGLQGGKPYVEVAGPAGSGKAVAANPFAPQSWHHLAVVAADAITLYVDGGQAGSVSAPLPELSANSLLGADASLSPTPSLPPPPKKGVQAPPPPPPAGFKGELDELQIAKVDRPVGFIRLAAIGQGPDGGKLFLIGPEEQSGSWSSGYFSIILQSVTPDGWVVIGLLALMALLSWIVMASKASYLSRVERANDRFTAKFRESSGDLAGLVARGGQVGETKRTADSPLQQILLAGAEEIRKRTDGTQALHAEEIEAIRSSLHAELLRANQRLNRNMVLLTIAISGGPFLGLLGTVVGVMITFASIAAAGDVNVNAIAPGIAAALVATVAGLGVAIPALFGYNWLLTRIKNSSTTMQVFVDELVSRIAEAYSERALEPPTQSPRLAAAE